MATTDGYGRTPVNSSDISTLPWLLSSYSYVTETESTPFSSPDQYADPIKTTVLVVVQDVIYIGLLPVLVIIGVTTNVINLVIFARQGLADRINMCLFSLSLADLGYVVALMAATSHRLLSLLNRELGQYWKVRALHTVVAVSRGFMATSNVLTMIISLERCACVLAPLHAKRFYRTRSMALVIVAVFVFVVGLYGLFNLKYVTVVRIDPSTNTTVYVPGLGSFYLQHRAIIDAIYIYVLSTTIPTTSLVVVIISTTITVVQLRVSLAWRKETATLSVNDTKEVALTKMLVAICCLYVVCTTPTVTKALLVGVLPDFLPSGRYANSFYMVVSLTHTLAATNSSVNFFFYCALGSKYRASLKSLFRQRKTPSMKFATRASESRTVTDVDTLEP